MPTCVGFFFFSCEESGCQAKGIRQGLHRGAEVLALVGNSLGLELLICEMGRDEASRGCFVVQRVHYVICTVPCWPLISAAHMHARLLARTR